MEVIRGLGIGVGIRFLVQSRTELPLIVKSGTSGRFGSQISQDSP